jgi:hypothetical protein
MSGKCIYGTHLCDDEHYDYYDAYDYDNFSLQEVNSKSGRRGGKNEKKGCESIYSARHTRILSERRAKKRNLKA